MTHEFFLLLVAMLGGGGAVGAVAGGFFTKRKLAAETEQIAATSEKIRIESADMLITRLSLQLTEAVNRISLLEKSERALQGRVQHLEWALRQNGIEPPDPETHPFHL